MRPLNSIIVITAALALPLTAQAADLKTRPIYKAPYAWSWSGFYIGLNAGGGVGMDSSAQSASFTSAALATNGLLSSTNRYNPTGWVFGGQVGYNYQISSWLIGVEADWQWASQKDSASNCTPAATIGFFGAGANGFGYCLASEQKLRNMATARARAGFIVNDVLWYATGGAAWATVKDSYQFSGSANAIILPGALQPGPFLPGGADFSTSRRGWTLGAGVEARLWGGWSAKLEYLYVDLGSITETFAIAINPAFGPAFTTGGAASATTTSHVRDNIVRVGINYKFGNSTLF
jgi:outer membrane immunogenic protein